MPLQGEYGGAIDVMRFGLRRACGRFAGTGGGRRRWASRELEHEGCLSGICRAGTTADAPGRAPRLDARHETEPGRNVL
ncbi:hypothetical protein GCM10010145_61600 [Streptomyces ruber]|uniref:Uncharacterized protein n=2 Tax=Streptomyces TaxID=1883 RepID=A0A918BPU0_9ACTN|nr:hypothetical protein GCM10010145_61600 [Streptomyces ruber]